ncbi:unnamed protein product [Musa acuminata subsp. malaccensis]|uniref:(wild Malaysian banana) hypothetical protein n=1 Tax=Musa acuminata subsp. malaccensis TaxID=214687 RepID=A0A804I0J7_MUSAM|nr:PREDICTED: UDP-glycosyltransferase 72B1-like [Musa acuminata subsp. malaccensis]CAG1861443.1 unnamed protein product [Musa acuminata subsp. malaccensis]
MPRLPDPVAVPGCLPIHWKDLPDMVKDRTTEGYRSLLQQLKRYEKAEGILVNSFQEMEPEAAMVLKEKKPGRPPVHLVGPLVQTGRPSSSPEESLCLKWLDEQPDASVLYICLGSLGVLSRDQVKEMALGLETRGHRFLWVVRRPADNGIVGGSEDDPASYLPHGFLERTTESGLVVSFWTPQIQILSHRAVGGFVTHCGWSSTLESVVHGVPMIAWPLYAEQRMNELMLAEGRKVASRAKEDNDGVVRREQISAAVRELMEREGGRVVLARVRQLQEAAAAKAMVKEAASRNALHEVVAKWKNTF